MTHAPPILKIVPLLMLGWLGACEIRCESIRPDRIPQPASELPADAGSSKSDGGGGGGGGSGAGAAGGGGADGGGATDGGVDDDSGEQIEGKPGEAPPVDPQRGVPS